MFRFAVLLLVLAAARPAWAETAVPILPVTPETKNEACLDCHAEEGYAVPIGEHGETPKRH